MGCRRSWLGLRPVAEASLGRAILDPFDSAQDPAGGEGVHLADDRAASMESVLELAQPALASSASW